LESWAARADRKLQIHMETVSRRAMTPAPAPDRSTDLIIAIVLANSVTFTCLTLATPRIIEVPAEWQLGLVTHAPAVYWVGLSLAFVSLLLALKRSWRVFLTSASMLCLTWNSLPALLVDTPYRLDSNILSGLIESVSQAGSIDFSRAGQSYLQFPGFIILGVQMSQMSASPPLAIARWSTLLWVALFVLSLSIFVRRLFGDGVFPRIAFLAAAFGTVWLQFHFAPQALSISFLMMITWALLRGGVGGFLSATIMGLWLAISHPPTMVFLTLLLTTVAIARYVLPGQTALTPRSGEPSRERRAGRPSPSVLSAIVVLWIAWMVYVASGTLANVIRILSTFLAAEGSFISPGTGPAEYQVTSGIRIGAFLVIAGLGTLSLVLLFRRGDRSTAFVLTSCWLVAAIPFGVALYPLHLVDRFYMIFFPVAAICVAPLALSVKGKRAAASMVVVLVVCATASASTIYRDSSQYVVPFRWAGPAGGEFRFLDEYPLNPCPQGTTIYIDDFTILWTTAHLGSRSLAESLRTAYERGSRVYDDGTTVGFWRACGQ
jgi:hypothetical protein